MIVQFNPRGLITTVQLLKQRHPLGGLHGLICFCDKCKSLVGKFRQFSDKLQSRNLCFTFHRLLGASLQAIK